MATDWESLTPEERQFWLELQRKIDETGGKARVVGHITKNGQMEFKIIVLKAVK